MYNFTVSSLFKEILLLLLVSFIARVKGVHFIRSEGIRADTTVLSEKNYWLSLLSQFIG